MCADIVSCARECHILIALAFLAVIASTCLSFLKLGLFPQLVVAASLLSCALYPAVFQSADAVRHVGIAGSVAQFSTYSISILAAFLVITVEHRTRGAWGPILPLAAWIALGVVFFWPDSSEMWAGTFQLLLGCCGWVVGNYLGTNVLLHARVFRFIGFVGALIVFAQLALVTLQLLGFPINPMDAIGSSMLVGRYNGSFGHPNDLGKAIFLVMALILPATRAMDPHLRRVSIIALGGGLLVLMMTGGRAVGIGALMMLLVWIVIAPRNGAAIGRRTLLLLTASVVGLGVVGSLLGRFDEDPTGGARGTLTDLALQQIALRPLIGVGPNSYVGVVGQFDSLTASGVPVHNAALLAAGELGIPGAIALSLPLLVCLFAALRARRVTEMGGDFARAVIAFLPGLALIAWTGWGLLGSSILPLLFLVLGIMRGAMRTQKVHDENSLRQAGQLRKWSS